MKLPESQQINHFARHGEGELMNNLLLFQCGERRKDLSLIAFHV